ncbi:hypothetical protein MTP99_014817 [Tenebrio molitor]|nr:hypothetical protein MTP99_014817 [Tenebrio molitor]
MTFSVDVIFADFTLLEIKVVNSEVWACRLPPALAPDSDDMDTVWPQHTGTPQGEVLFCRSSASKLYVFRLPVVGSGVSPDRRAILRTDKVVTSICAPLQIHACNPPVLHSARAEDAHSEAP